MKRILRFLSWTVVLLVVLSASLVIYLRNADLSVYETQIENYLSSKIGHRLDIDGRFNLQVRGGTTLSAESVSLVNANWQGESQLLTIGRLSVNVDTWSMFVGPMIVRDLQLDDIDVRIELDDDGLANWSTGRPVATEKSAVELNTDFIAFRNVELDEARISYRAVQRPRPIIAAIDHLRVSPDEGDILDLDLLGTINDYALSASGSVGPWQNLIVGRNISADLDAGLGKVALAVRGSVDDLVALGGVDVTFDLRGPSIDQVSERLGLPVFAYGAFELDGSVSGADGDRRLEVEGKVGDVDLSINGTVNDLRAPDEADFAAQISGPNVSDVARLFDVTGLPEEPYQVSGSYSLRQTTVSLSDARVRIGDNALLVDGWIDARRMPPDMDITINAVGPDFSVFTPFIGVTGVPASAFDIDGRIRSKGGDWQFDEVEATVGENRVVAHGAISAGADTEVVFSASGPDNSFLHAMTGLEGLPARPYDVSARIRPSRVGIELADARASFGDHRIAVDGVVALKGGLIGTALSVNVSGPDLQNIALLTDVPYLPAGPYDASARIAFDRAGLVLDQAEASVGPLRATADGSIGLRRNAGDFELALSASGPDLGSLAKFDLLQRLSGEPFDVSAQTRHRGDAYEFESVEAKIGQLDAFIDAEISDDGSRTTIDFRGAAPDARPVSRLLGIEALPDGAFSADGRVEIRRDEFELTDSRVQIGAYRLVADGVLSTAPMKNDSDLQFSAAGPDLQQLLDTFDIDLFPAKPFTLGGAFRGTPSGFAMRDFAATIGGNDVAGEFTADFREKPTISGALSSKYLDLSERLPKAEEGATEAGSDPGGLLFPDEPINLGFLDAANAQVEVTVDKLILDEVSIDNFNLGVQLIDSNLSVAPISIRSTRGNLDGSLGLRPSNGDYEWIASLEVSNGRLGLAGAKTEDLSQLPMIDGTIDLRG
ncbi:MAG: AsmA family protein, partial [Gammaproteobacteria bacterium]|nr:AsmA family protein [Gammaproteobacteria bacterium]